MTAKRGRYSVTRIYKVRSSSQRCRIEVLNKRADMNRDTEELPKIIKDLEKSGAAMTASQYAFHTLVRPPSLA